jgi:hypothetical protein
MVTPRRRNATHELAESLSDGWRWQCPSMNLGWSRQQQDPAEHHEPRNPHQPVQPLRRHLCFLTNGNPRKSSSIPGQLMATAAPLRIAAESPTGSQEVPSCQTDSACRVHIPRCSRWMFEVEE